MLKKEQCAFFTVVLFSLFLHSCYKMDSRHYYDLHGNKKHFQRKLFSPNFFFTVMSATLTINAEIRTFHIKSKITDNFNIIHIFIYKIDCPFSQRTQQRNLPLEIIYRV